MKQLDENYFFPSPETFVYSAFPIDSRWQLLTKRWDISKFVDVPFCKAEYFQEELEIHSRFSGRLVAKHGECHVEITSRKPEELSLNYELYYNHKESGRDISPSLQLSNYVLMDKSNKKWNFGIRFPEAGIYKLQIVGGRGRIESNLCAFRINCDAPQEDCKPLPFNPGRVGYGPNSITEKAGVKALSHKDAIVNVHVRRQLSFRFQMTHEVTVQTELRHTTIATEKLSHFLVQEQHKR